MPDLFYDEVDRFAAMDPQWRMAIELMAAPLGADARRMLGVCLSGFMDLGPLPPDVDRSLLRHDDGAGISAELPHMDRRFHDAFICLFRYGALPNEALATIQGIMTAVHRFLRNA